MYGRHMDQWKRMSSEIDKTYKANGFWQRYWGNSWIYWKNSMNDAEAIGYPCANK